MEHVKLIGTIYVEPAIRFAWTSNTRSSYFEQQERSKKLEEELKVALHFLMWTTTSIVALEPHVIVISDLEEEVEVISQPTVEEQPQLTPESNPLEEKTKLQQPMSRDNGEEFLQELFEEASICNIIPQSLQSRMKVMMKRKGKAPTKE